MNVKIWMRLAGILAVLLGVTPMLAVAQGYGRDRTEERGTIRIDNNRRDTVYITVWTDRGKRIGKSWRFNSGESAFLAVGKKKIKVLPNDQINVGSDGGRAKVRNVGQFQSGVWYVKVRDLWRVTHRDQGYERDRSPSQRKSPDYLR